MMKIHDFHLPGNRIFRELSHVEKHRLAFVMRDETEGRHDIWD
jgi:hypothetical protein